MVENKYYERKIKYLDLLENGERLGGAGFVKTEVRGTDVSLGLTVKGLHPTDTYERDVILQDSDGESAVGRISLKEGQGQFTYHAVMDYSRLRGIRIVLGGAREISCSWQEEKKARAGRGSAMPDSGVVRKETDERSEPQKPQKSQEIQVIAWDEVKAAEESLERVKKMASKPTERAAEESGAGEVPGETERATRRDVRRALGEERRQAVERNAGRTFVEETGDTIRNTERTAGWGTGKTTGKNAADQNIENSVSGKNTERRTDRTTQRPLSGKASGREKRPVRLMEDKWQQIWAIYPHIHPFQDEREYLSIGPADFVLLSEEAYRAANNSFLLHGYYNYDHLILTRIEKRGEVTYYIGVPGNYYEREKQVAVMFGFESFECGTEPAQAGDFGYYMMRTQL